MNTTSLMPAIEPRHYRWDSHPAEPMKGLLTRRIFLAAGDKMEVDVFNPPREDSVQGNDAYLRR